MATSGSKSDFGEHATKCGNKRDFGELTTKGGNKRDFGEHETKRASTGVSPPRRAHFLNKKKWT